MLLRIPADNDGRTDILHLAEDFLGALLKGVILSEKSGAAKFRRLASKDLERLATIAKVSESDRLKLKLSVNTTLEIVWTQSRRRKEFQIYGLSRECRRIAKAANNLEKLIRESRSAVRRSLVACLPYASKHRLLIVERSQRYGGIERSLQLNDYRQMTAELAAIARSAAGLGLTRDHIKLGYLKRYLVLRLLSDVADAGGRLTINKNLRGGSLIQALDVLAGYAPADLNIETQSASTLNRWKIEWTKSREQPFK